MKIKYIIALLLLLMFVLGFASALFKSRTSDEVTYHLNGGYHFLKTGEWIAPIDNPPLSGILVSIPLLFVDKGRFRNFERLSIEDYVYERKETFPRNILLTSRIVPLMFMVALGYFVFLWARDLYGTKAGLFALLLYVFSSNMLAYGRFVTTDIGSVLFMFLSLYTFWKYAKEPNKKNLAVASIVFGLAQISKMFALFLVPTFIIYAVIVYFFKDFGPNFFMNFNNKKAKKAFDLGFSLLVIFIVGLFMINMAYLFDGSLRPLIKYDKEEFESATFKSLHENRLVNWIPLPFPKPYVIAHDYGQWLAKEEDRAYFYWGKVGRGFDFKSYYLGYILIKTPIGLFIILLLSLLCARKINYSEAYMLIFIAILLLALTFLSQVRLGYRHVLVVYPLLYVFSGRIFKDGIPKNKLILGIVIISTLWYVISALYIFPHYLAYFNELIGGPKNGYKYAIDSNLDWEQDLDLVKKYIRESQAPILIDPGCKPFTGRAAIPANSLQFQKGVCYQWLKQNFEPIGYIGYSWLVYDVKGTWKESNGQYFFTKG